MKTLTTVLMILFLLPVVYGQQNTKEDEIKITVVKTIINNGDTTIDERTMEGEEARAFLNRHDKMKARFSDMDEEEIEEDETLIRRHHGGNRPPGEHHVEKVVIHRSGDKKGTEEVIIRGDEDSNVRKKVVVRTISDDEKPGNIDIELEDGRLIIIKDGVREVIELDKVNNKVMQAEGERSGKGVRKIIVIEEKEEIENGKKDDKMSIDSPLKLEVMPNPNSGLFTIEFKLMDNGKATLNVTDAKGKKIMEETLKGEGLQKKQIDIQQFGSGIYVINLNQNNEALSKKIIVE